MISFKQSNPSYQLLSIHLILGGILSLTGIGAGTITLMLGLLAGLSIINDAYQANRVGVKNMKRGIILLGIWLTIGMGLSLIPFALPALLGVALPFVGTAASIFILLEQRYTKNNGLLLMSAWLLVRSIIPFLILFGIDIPLLLWVIDILGIAAGYFLIQDK